MIQINKIEEQFVEIFDSNNHSLGFASEKELMDIRYQIVENQNMMTVEESQQPSGYYFVYKNEKYPINKNGQHEHPTGLFDKWDYLFWRWYECKNSKIILK